MFYWFAAVGVGFFANAWVCPLKKYYKKIN
jgi:hypothetical protein